MPYFRDNRSRLRREDDGPAEIPGDHDAHVCVKAQQEVQATMKEKSSFFNILKTLPVSLEEGLK